MRVNGDIIYNYYNIIVVYLTLYRQRAVYYRRICLLPSRRLINAILLSYRRGVHNIIIMIIQRDVYVVREHRHWTTKPGTTQGQGLGARLVFGGGRRVVHISCSVPIIYYVTYYALRRSRWRVATAGWHRRRKWSGTPAGRERLDLRVYLIYVRKKLINFFFNFK